MGTFPVLRREARPGVASAPCAPAVVVSSVFFVILSVLSEPHNRVRGVRINRKQKQTAERDRKVGRGWSAPARQGPATGEEGQGQASSGGARGLFAA